MAVIEQFEGLRTAMQTRHVIGMAQGALRVRYGSDEDQAFRFLSRLSQESNVQLRELAVQVTDELTKEGWPSERRVSLQTLRIERQDSFT